MWSSKDADCGCNNDMPFLRFYKFTAVYVCLMLTVIAIILLIGGG